MTNKALRLGIKLEEPVMLVVAEFIGTQKVIVQCLHTLGKAGARVLNGFVFLLGVRALYARFDLWDR